MSRSIKNQIFFEPNYGDSKHESQIMIAKRPQIEKVPQTFTGATCLLAEKGPGGGGLKVPMHPKLIQNCHF